MQHNYLLGTDSDNDEVVDIDLTKIANFNFSFVGMSGSGKTYTIKKMLENFWRSRITVFAPDTQGDLSYIDGDYSSDIPQEAFVENKFHYNDEIGNCSINFLEVPKGRDSGGVLSAVRDAVYTIKLFHPSMGIQQSAALRSLLEETYQRAGIVDSDPGTWSLNAPDVSDLLETIKDHKKAIISGVQKTVFDEIHKMRKELVRDQVKLDNLYAKAAESQSQSSRDKAELSEKEFDANVEALVEKTGEMIRSEIRHGKTEQVTDIKLSVIENIEPIISDMVKSKLFCGRPPLRPEKGRINILNMKGLVEQEMLALYHIILGRTFSAAVQTCRQLNPKTPSMMIVFDEAKIVQHVSRDSMSPFPRIITEGRKFGLGALIGCQIPAQISDEIRRNISAFFQLPVVRESQDESRRKLKLPKGMIEGLIARKEALLSLNGGEYRKIDMWRFT